MPTEVNLGHLISSVSIKREMEIEIQRQEILQEGDKKQEKQVQIFGRKRKRKTSKLFTKKKEKDDARLVCDTSKKKQK